MERTKIRIEFSCLKLPISRVFRRVTKRNQLFVSRAVMSDGGRKGLGNILSIPDTIQRPNNDTVE